MTRGAASTDEPDADAGTTSEARDPEPLTVQLQSVPSGSMSFLYWAHEEGLYERAGIDLEILPGQSSQGTVEAVAQGNADIGLASGVAVVLGAANGQEVRSVGHFFGGSTFGLFVPGEDDDPAAMAAAVEGGSVLTIAGGPQNVLFDAFLEASGVDPASVTKTNVPITSLVQLYADGEGDGLITVVPFADTLVQGQRPSASLLFRDVTGVEPPDTAIVVRPDLLEDKADLVRRFLTVSYEALAEQREDPDATVAALVGAEPTLTAEIARGQLDGQLPYMCPLGAEGSTVGRTAAEQWNDAIALFQAAAIVGDLEASAVYTDEFFDSDTPVSTEQC